LTLSALTFGLVSTVIVSALMAGPQFSADTVQLGTDGRSTSGKLIVGDGRVRMEMHQQGQQVVRISDENRGVEWILFPEQRRYIEHRLASPGEEPPARSSVEDPCAGMPSLKCQKTGEEQVAGRTAAVWEVVVDQQGEVMKGTQWIDKERGPSFMLRQELPSGQTMERFLVGEEDLDGRQTEKWKIDVTGPDGQAVSTFEWYDPELAIAVRQEFPGGLASELSNIRIGLQPDQLFGVPAGYERMTAPQGMSKQSPRR